jgi:transposase
MELVRIACQMPDEMGRSFSQWDCRELARELVEQGVVEEISPQTVQRLLADHRLKPWRHHAWLGKKAPRDEEFISRTKEICDLYTRQLLASERVLCFDEKTSIQPRPRLAPTRPAQPGRPIQVENEYERKGALNLLAAFDTRTGVVYGRTYPRKRQAEVIDLLNLLDREFPAHVTVIHIICDNSRTHYGRKVRAWLSQHPRFVFHFTPVHCSWMNQVEQWFSILQRKRLSNSNFKDCDDLSAKIADFIRLWNEVANPFRWTRASFNKVLAKAEDSLAAA